LSDLELLDYSRSLEGLYVKNIKWVFVLYSLAALLCMFAIGISVGLRSIPGVLVSILFLIFVMGFGFKTKKKLREQGLL